MKDACKYKEIKEVKNTIYNYHSEYWCRKHKQFLTGITCLECPEYEKDTLTTHPR
jgi:hypothetical protein